MGSASSLLVLFHVLLYLGLAFSGYNMPIVSYGDRPRKEEEIRKLYDEWLAKHGGTNNALGGERERRFRVFKENLHFIDTHNAAADAGQHSFRLDLNRFADLTNEEYRSVYLGIRMNTTRRSLAKMGVNRYQYSAGGNLPKTVDWRVKGAVAPVKDQGSCGPSSTPHCISIYKTF